MIGIHPSTISAMKRSGLKFSDGRLTTVAAVRKWMRAHPDWTTREAYPRPAAQPTLTTPPKEQSGGKSDERLSRHAPRFS